MVRIIYTKQLEQVIKAPAVNSFTLLKGPTGCGKTATLMERYRYMVEQLHIPSEKILVLVLNKQQSEEWKNSIRFHASGNLWKTTYMGFIQDELIKFYPLLLKNCHEIVHKLIQPVFLSFEASRFLMTKVIEKQRLGKGVFMGIAAESDKIAGDVLTNYLKAALSGIPYHEIGQRLYSVLEIKSAEKESHFRDMDDLLTAYRKKCLELGIFDFAMAVELYHRCLCGDETYQQLLFQRVQHLIVDNIEECLPKEADFIELLLHGVKTSLLGYNFETGWSEASGCNAFNTAEKLQRKCTVVELSESYTCNQFMVEFSSMLFDHMEHTKVIKTVPGIGIERHPAVELRSDMLEKVGERVIKLVTEEGFKPSDIVILSTYADPVTEQVLRAFVQKSSIGLYNIAAKDSYTDDPYGQAFLTFAQLCHPAYGQYPQKEEISLLIRILFQSDPVRSSILADEIYCQKPYPAFPPIDNSTLEKWIEKNKAEKYYYVKKWVDEYKVQDKPLRIDEFFLRAFLEIFLSEAIEEHQIRRMNELIDCAANFIEGISGFGGIHADRGFLEVLRKGIAMPENISMTYRGNEASGVILGTPAAFLRANIKCKVAILTSLSSHHWMQRNVKELTNHCVLTGAWDQHKIYSEQVEEENQKKYLARLIRAIIKRCGEKLITYESSLSADGYENDGILAEYFDAILTG